MTEYKRKAKKNYIPGDFYLKKCSKFMSDTQNSIDQDESFLKSVLSNQPGK